MITAKQLKDTYPHRQMRMYIDAEYPGLEPALKAARFGALVKKFLLNFNENPHGGGGWDQRVIEEVPDNIDEAFLWANTPEGHDFWKHINSFMPVEIVEAPKPAKGKAPKKRVGWWH